MRFLLQITLLSFYLLFQCPSTAWTQITGQAPSPLPPYFLTADFDHDGQEEIIYEEDDWITVAHRNGLSLTILDKVYFVNAGTLQTGDLDGDGFPEIITTFYQYVYYIKNNHGTLGEIVLVEQQPFTAADYKITYAYDLDRDGDDDLVLGKNDGKMYIIESKNGKFQANDKIKILDTGASGGGYIKFCDYNQDGNMDLLFYQVYYGAYILLNAGNWHFTSERLSNALNPLCFDIGDFNGDGYPDIVQAYRTTGKLEIHLNPYGSLPWVYYADSVLYQDAIDIVDIDQDNIPEILLGDNQSISVFDLENGIIHQREIWGQTETVFGSPSSTLDAFDFDNDGKYEIRHTSFLVANTLLETNYLKTQEEYSCDQKTNPLDCPLIDITFLTQADIEAFASQFPFCSILNRGLTITGEVTDLSLLKNIRFVNGSLILQNTNLDSIPSWDLAFVNGDVIIENNAKLKHYQFDQLQFINGNLRFQHLSDITDITGLNRLENVHSIFFEDLPQLKSISGLRGLNSADDVSIIQLPLLDSITGLYGVAFDTLTIESTPVKFLRSISSAKTIWISNTSITTLAPYSYLTPDNLILENISQLTSLVGLKSNNTYDFTIRNCPQLAHFGMSFKINNLELVNNPVLADLPEFTTSALGVDHARIIKNPLLHNLNGLASIYRFQTELTLEQNDGLQDVSALTVFQFANLDTLTIAANPLLHSCEIDAICGYLAVYKFAHIQDNGSGCSNENEIRIACGLPTGIYPDPSQHSVSVYPNPATEDLFVDAPQIPDRLTLYDLHACQILDNTRCSKLSLDDVPAGLYLLKVVESNQVTLHKILILK